MLTRLYVRVSTRISMLRNQRGATAVEYGIMVALIAVTIIATVSTIGGELNRLFSIVSDKLVTTSPAAPL